MFQSILDDLKIYFQSGNMISRLIIINVIVFIVILFVKLGLMSTGDQYPENIRIFTKYIALSSDLWFNLKHPWVLITHAFTHFGFFHILFNMLYLIWFGRIVGDLLGDHRILPLYILGTLCGAVFYITYASFFINGYVPAYGASAAVWAIIMAAGFIAPDYNVNLILIGPVRIKYIIAVLIVLNLLSFTSMENVGGQIAHLGGGIIGGLFVVGLRNGRDIAAPINDILDKLSNIISGSGQSKPKVKSPLKVSFKAEDRRFLANRHSDESFDNQSSSVRLDEILDKIKEKGIDSLNKDERHFLDQQSKKN